MKFDWSEFTEESYDKSLDDLNSHRFISDNCYGFVRVGELCIDLTCQGCEDGNELQYDFYVGGEDTGYGYSAREAMLTGKYETKYDVPHNELYPYDHADGGCFKSHEIEDLNYEDFKTLAEKRFEDFIKMDQALANKANMPLHKW